MTRITRYLAAHEALWRNTAEEYAAGIFRETPESTPLNSAACDSCTGVPQWCQSILDEWLLRKLRREGIDPITPPIEGITKCANRPDMRAAMGRMQREAWPCRCNCYIAHPDAPAACNHGQGVYIRELTSYTLGTIKVPLCAPCAVAQGWTPVSGH